MTSTTIICLVILLVIGVPLLLIGLYMVTKWDNRVKEWKKYPSSDEYNGALFQGWGGWMLTFYGFAITAIPVGYLIMLGIAKILGK